MTVPWWTRGSTGVAPPASPVEPGDGGTADPRLVADDVGAVRADVAERIPGYTPEWTDFSPTDAGVAIVRLFGSMAAPIRARVNRLPEQATIGHLDIAGIERLAARAARVDLQVMLSPGATESTLVPGGFQATADPVDDSPDRVTFETERDLYAAPATIDAAYREEQGRALELDLERSWRPFGDTPRQGAALWLGLAGDAAPTVGLSIGFRAAAVDDTPPPVLRGGLSTATLPPPPLISWEVLDGGRLVSVEVRLDETRAFQQSGIVDLRLPRTWRPSRPPSAPAAALLRWIRIGLRHGIYPEAPAIDRVRLNVVPAVAAPTIRNEPLSPMDERGDEGRVRMQLARRPVVPGSVEIEVDAAATDVFGTGVAAGRPDEPTVWTEVADLGLAGPDDRVFTLDPHTGVVEFGDGEHGRAVPDGFRNVRAARYRTGGGRGGNIGAEAGPSPLRTLPFVAGVDNPEPATGGTDAETRDLAVRRGPEEIRARGRAVALADYGLLARQAEGADVARAYAVRGLHPGYPGAPIPGLVGVFVVPPVRDGARPVASAATLGAVAEHLTAEVAPVGVQVVAAAPRFHDVRAEARVQFAPATELGAAIDGVLAALDGYLDPLTGGPSGTGWEPGAALPAVATMRHLLVAVPELRAVPQLNFVVDGVRFAPCVDAPIADHALVWPVSHEIVPVEGEAAP